MRALRFIAGPRGSGSSWPAGHSCTGCWSRVLARRDRGLRAPAQPRRPRWPGERWGDRRTVVVATVDLLPGQRLGPATPGRGLADGPPAGRRPVLGARGSRRGGGRSPPGEPLVARRLGRPRRRPGGRAAPGRHARHHRPVGRCTAAGAPGDRVDLVAAGVATGGAVVATDAMVVAVDERAVVVAVAPGRGRPGRGGAGRRHRRPGHQWRSAAIGLIARRGQGYRAM